MTNHAIPTPLPICSLECPPVPSLARRATRLGGRLIAWMREHPGARPTVRDYALSQIEQPPMWQRGA